MYLQLALYLQPNHSLALLSLADLYESVKKPAMAIKVYERVPVGSPLKRNAQIQLATDLDAADRSDEAIKILNVVEKYTDLQIDFQHKLMGGCAIDATGNPLPDDSLACAKAADAVLLGAVGGPKWGTGLVRPEQGMAIYGLN